MLILVYAYFVGEGAGVLNIQAETEDGSLQSETYEVLDCIKYDGGTLSNHNDIWNVNTSTGSLQVTRADTYTEFAEATIGNNTTNYVTGLTSSCVVEFDYYQIGEVSNTFMQIMNDTTQITTGGINLGQFNASLETWYHFKITIQDGTATILNETLNTTVTKSLSDTPTRFQFWTAGDITAIRFKNFKIYPI